MPYQASYDQDACYFGSTVLDYLSSAFIDDKVFYRRALDYSEQAVVFSNKTKTIQRHTLNKFIILLMNHFIKNCILSRCILTEQTNYTYLFQISTFFRII